MKKILLLPLIVVFSNLLFSQNLIQNGDFEQCDVVGGCPSSSGGTTEGKFNEFSNWHSFGHWTPTSGGSPDAFYDAYPSFNHYAGIFSQEGVYYDLGYTTAPTFFKLKFRMHGAEDIPEDNAINGRGLKFFGASVAPTPFSCDLFAGGIINEIASVRNDNLPLHAWTNWEGIVPAQNPFRYFVIRAQHINDCDEYVYFDDISLEDYCCADYALLQNYVACSTCYKVPNIVQRADYIRAGQDVGCPNTLVNKVNILSDQKVLFQAGNYISIEPGFNIEPGGVFTAQIASCGIVEPHNSDDYTINLKFYTTAAYFNCTGNYLNSMGFVSENATNYRVTVFDRWGEIVYQKSDMIHEQYTVYWDGSGAPAVSPENLYVVQLELFNCMEEKNIVKTFSMVPFYIDGCHPWSKTNETASTNENPNLVENIIFNAYPNPASDKVNVVYHLDKQSYVNFEFINGLGQIINSQLKESFPRQNFDGDYSFQFDVSTLPSGLYTVILKIDNVCYTKKILINNR